MPPSLLDEIRELIREEVRTIVREEIAALKGREAEPDRASGQSPLDGDAQ